MISGTNILVSSSAEVTNISPFGFWILVNGKEYFIDYTEYPVFEKASIREIAEVCTDVSGNLHWPLLDADIETDSLEKPSQYPLIFR